MVQSETMRDRLFNMRMNAEESARLEGIATHYGLNAAGAIRMLLKREADALGIGRITLAAKRPAKKSKGR